MINNRRELWNFFLPLPILTVVHWCFRKWTKDVKPLSSLYCDVKVEGHEVTSSRVANEIIINVYTTGVLPIYLSNSWIWPLLTNVLQQDPPCSQLLTNLHLPKNKCGVGAHTVHCIQFFDSVVTYPSNNWSLGSWDTYTKSLRYALGL